MSHCGVRLFTLGRTRMLTAAVSAKQSRLSIYTAVPLHNDKRNKYTIAQPRTLTTARRSRPRQHPTRTANREATAAIHPCCCSARPRCRVQNHAGERVGRQGKATAPTPQRIGRDTRHFRCPCHCRPCADDGRRRRRGERDAVSLCGHDRSWCERRLRTRSGSMPSSPSAPRAATSAAPTTAASRGGAVVPCHRHRHRRWQNGDIRSKADGCRPGGADASAVATDRVAAARRHRRRSVSCAKGRRRGRRWDIPGHTGRG